MNTFSSHARGLGAIFAAWAALGLGSGAQAQDRQCATDADCSGGLVCRFESYQRCSGDFSCTPEAGCTQAGPCETIENSWCGYSVCISDADCGEGKGCLEQFSSTCTAEIVDGVPRLVCRRDQRDSLCTPHYEMPCQVASDCGEGFNCVESFATACGPSGPNGEYECVQISNHVSYCEVIVVPCTAHADCPGVLECQLQYVEPPCTGGGVDEPLECPPPLQEYRCATPPFGGGTGGDPGGVGGMDGAGTGGEEPPPDAGDGGASGMSISGEGGMGGTGGSGGAGGASGTGAPDDDGEADEHRGHHHRRGLLARLLRGCSTTTIPSEGGSIGLLMLGAAALLLTRRSRRA
jgi:hypothetical protein